MEEKQEIQVTCYRFDPATDRKPQRQSYIVPIRGLTSVLNVLEYIQKNLDPSLAFYGCCRRGLCAKCSVQVNGVRGLACEMVVDGDVIIEPVSEEKVKRDLVTY